MAVLSLSGQISTFSIFRNRSFTLLWIGQLVTEMGTSLTALASSVYVYQVTGSALNVGLMMMASAIPSLLVGLFAGVFVDHYNRKLIMNIADLLRAGLILAIPFLLPVNIAWLYILVALSAAIGQSFSPAHASVLADIASEEELNAANSLMAVSSFGSLVIGYGLAGLLTASHAIEWVFYIDAATFLFSALFVALTHIPEMQAQETSSLSKVVSNLGEGLKTIKDTPILRSLFVVYFPVFIGIGFAYVLRLPFTIRALGATVFEYGLIESLALVGLVPASLLMARYGNRLREGPWLAISFIGMGCTGTIFSLLSNVPMAMVIVIIEGFINAPSIIARSSIIQRHTPRDRRGRVFSAFFVMRDTMFMAGMAMAGLADIFDLRLLYLLTSVSCLIMGLMAIALPGLGQPVAEWRRALQMLRAAPGAPRLGLGRALAPADFDHLVALVPQLATMPEDSRKRLYKATTVHEVPEGTMILRIHEASDAAYFILKGQAIASRDEQSGYRELETMCRGEFFGEIAAITGIARTANVVATQPTTLIQVPATTLREIISDAHMNRLILNRMTERMMRINMIDLALPGHYNQNALRELRSSAEVT